MLIILEGPDGGGKSYLARLLVDTLHATYPGDQIELWHKGPPSQHPLDEYERPLFYYRPGTSRHIVCDRWHLGEWIYPQLLNRSTQADLPTWRHINLFLQSRGALIVYVAPPLHTLLKNVEERGDDLVNVTQVSQLSLAYASLLNQSPLSCFRYDYTQRDPYVINRIISWAQRFANSAKKLNPFVTYVGPPQPGSLLLGDVRHQLRYDANTVRSVLTIDHGPAFGPYRNTSGHFLLTHLSLWKWNLEQSFERSIGIANACDVDDPERLWKTLGEPKTVALGHNAAKAAPWAIRCAHPQYIKRFHNTLGPKYGQSIADALNE